MSSLASSYSEPKLIFKYDVCLTFCKDLKDGVRTFLEDCLRDAGFKTSIADIFKVSAWEMKERCKIVVVVITPQFVRSDDVCLERLVDIMSNPKTVLPFFYGLNQNELLVQFEGFYVPKFRCEGSPDGVSLGELSEAYRSKIRKSGDSIFDRNSQRRAAADCSSLFGFTLSTDSG